MKKEPVVLITGASIGIGRETAYKFSEIGAKLILTYYKDKEEMATTVQKCKDLGAKEVVPLFLDVMDNTSINRVQKAVIDRFQKIDVLVNNAGVIAWKPLREQSFDEIELQIRTNLEGLIKITKYFLPYVNETVINVSSGAGKTGYADLTTYCGTKFGVRGFTQALASENQDINVYSVNPGMTKTRMTNFAGIHPSKVGEIILQTAKDGYGKPSGSDVDVWEYT